MALPDLASDAAVVLCVDLRHDLAGFWSDRQWLALGAGACVVRRDATGLNPAMPMHVYQDVDGLVDLVGRLRGDVGQRRAIGTAAREYVMGGHTYEHRLRELLRNEPSVMPCSRRSRPGSGRPCCPASTTSTYPAAGRSAGQRRQRRP